MDGSKLIIYMIGLLLLGILIGLYLSRIPRSGKHSWTGFCGKMFIVRLAFWFSYHPYHYPPTRVKNRQVVWAWGFTIGTFAWFAFHFECLRFNLPQVLALCLCLELSCAQFRTFITYNCNKFIMVKKLEGWRYVGFISGLVGFIGLAAYPTIVHPMMYPDQYKRIQAITRKDMKQEDIQPGNMKVWSDPFGRK